MTVPQEYWHATRDFQRYLGDLKEISLLQTHNQCYAVTRAVLHVFRSHLELQQALAFADVLPPVLRAIFVEEWTPLSPGPPFPERQALHAEVMAIRPDHNTAPATAISDVATALRRNIDPRRLDAVLDQLGSDAQSFWVPAGG